MTRELATFARLGALGHFDLDLVCAGKVFCTDAKATRSNLCDLGAHRVTLLQGYVSSNAISAELAGQGGANFDATLACT